MTPAKKATAPASDPEADATDGDSLREQRRREKDKVSRAHILDAAERVFGQKGFHKATLKEVAEEAEFSVGALYAFFEGKDDLFGQVLQRRGDQFLELLEVAVSGDDLPPVKLHRIVDVSVDYFRANPDYYRLFQRELGGTTWSFRANLNAAGLQRYQAAMAIEERLFAEGVAANAFVGDDPAVLAALYSGLVQAWLAQWVFTMDADGASGVEHSYPLSELHALIDRAFVRS